MNIKAWIPLVLAIVLGLIAALLARNITRPQTSGLTSVGEVVEVVTASRNIAPGEAIRPGDLVMRPIATDAAPEGTFLSIDELDGRVAQVQMVKGQPVLESLLAPQGVAAGLEALVPEGMRAITIEVDEFSGLAGMIRPQSRVDVLATIRGNDSSIARTIVQNVEVKAVGRRMSTAADGEAEEERERKRSVTLLVTLEQAEAIELAAETGRPRLVLRGSNDQAVEPTRGVTLVELRGGTEPAERTAPAGVVRSDQDPFETDAPVVQAVQEQEPLVHAKRRVEVIRGGVVSHVEVEYRRPESVITGMSIE